MHLFSLLDVSKVSFIDSSWIMGTVQMAYCALTLGHLYRAQVRFTPVLILDRLASVSTPTVLKSTSIPWPEHTWGRCAQATVQMLISRHAHTHGYAT
jgi:hypothetical protein